jgi:hypothetical protein
MWDMMRDVAVKAGWLTARSRPSFSRDIVPVFRRLAGLQWVNAGFAAGFGWEGAVDLTSPSAIARLGDPGAAYQDLRRGVANAFRRFDVDSWSPKPWPWLYGGRNEHSAGRDTAAERGAQRPAAGDAG